MLTTRRESTCLRSMCSQTVLYGINDNLFKLKDPFPGSRGLGSRADAMALDPEGRLYVATGSGVQVIDSRGKHLGTIKVPTMVRNVAFGGPERHTMYMTAPTELYRITLVSQGPPGRMK